MNAYDYIEEYIAGKLHGDQLVEFEKALEMDVELKKVVDNYDVLKKASEGLLEAELLRGIRTSRGSEGGSGVDEEGGLEKEEDEPESATESQRPEESPKVNVAKRPSMYPQIWKYAAAGLFIVMAGWLIYQATTSNVQRSGTEIFAEHYQEPIWQLTKSGNDEVNYIEKATGSYLNGDFERAKALLRDSVDNKAVGNYWMAQMYLKENMPDEAFQILPKSKPPEVLSDSYHFLKTMIYLKQNKLSEAKDAARNLSEDYLDLKELLEQF